MSQVRLTVIWRLVQVNQVFLVEVQQLAEVLIGQFELLSGEQHQLTLLHQNRLLLLVGSLQLLAVRC